MLANPAFFPIVYFDWKIEQYCKIVNGAIWRNIAVLPPVCLRGQTVVFLSKKMLFVKPLELKMEAKMEIGLLYSRCFRLNPRSLQAESPTLAGQIPILAHYIRPYFVLWLKPYDLFAKANMKVNENNPGFVPKFKIRQPSVAD